MASRGVEFHNKKDQQTKAVRAKALPPDEDGEEEELMLLATTSQWKKMLYAKRTQAAADLGDSKTAEDTKRKATITLACCDYVDTMLRQLAENKAERHELDFDDVRVQIDKAHSELVKTVDRALASGRFSKFHVPGLRKLESDITRAALGLYLDARSLMGDEKEILITSVLAFMAHAFVGIDVVTY